MSILIRAKCRPGFAICRGTPVGDAETAAYLIRSFDERFDFRDD